MKKNYKNYILFSVIVAFAAAAFGLMIYSGARLIFPEKPAEKKSAEAGKECVAYRKLDGVCLTAGETEKYPVGVMIDNKFEARPQSGLSYAGLVYEAPVEGGITRFLAIFTTDELIKKIGPVRSVRPYYIDWASEFNAIMAHIGGSPEALGIIAADDDLKKLNIDGDGNYFWRSEDRIAPHNAYTSSKILDNAREKKLASQDLQFDLWEFKNDSFSSERGDAKTVAIQFGNDPTYDAAWEYDKEKNEYRRKIGNDYAKDEDGRMILAKNIAVLSTDIEIIDEVSRRRIITVGSGEALIFQDGKKIQARWEKRDRAGRLYFFDLNGAPIQFNRGTIWVEVVDDLAKVAEK